MKKIIAIIILFISTSGQAQSWKSLPFDRTTHQDSYYDLYFHSETNGHLVGDNWSYLQTYDAGKSWTKKDISSLVDSVFSRVIFLNDNVGFLQGQGTIYKTLDGGDTWTKLNLGVYRNCINISNGQVYAYGDQGFGSLYFARYFEAQDSFDTQQGAWPMYTLEKLVYLGDSTLIIAKDTGKIYRSTDLGKTFDLVANNMGLRKNYSSRVRDIYFKDKDTGFVSYHHWGLAHTVDGGVNWTVDSVYYNNSITRFVGWKNKVHFSSGIANVLYRDQIMNYKGIKLISDTNLLHQDFRNTNFNLVATNGSSLYIGLDNNIYYKSPLSLRITNHNPFNLKIYPNPSNGKFSIELPSTNSNDIRLEITNALGQKIDFEQRVNGDFLDVELKESGLHFN